MKNRKEIQLWATLGIFALIFVAGIITNTAARCSADESAAEKIRVDNLLQKQKDSLWDVFDNRELAIMEISTSCFNSQHWGRHLGIKQIELRKHGFKDYLYRNELLDKQSIAIEIDCWGGLILGDNSTKKFGNRLVKTLPGKFYNAYGNVIDVSKNPVEECKWRGYDFFQKYSDAQIDTLAWILPHLMEANEIPNYGLKDGNFDVRLDALKGEPGIFSHSNYRKDKSDLYPDTRIVKMLNSL